MIEIYWACPLHRKEDCEITDKLVEDLREHGFTVFVPKEIGVTDKESDTDVSALPSFYCRTDTDAVHSCDVVVACIYDREPSDGQLLEIGMGLGLHKPVVVYFKNSDPNKEISLSLMIRYNCTIFTDWDKCVDYLRYLTGKTS